MPVKFLKALQRDVFTCVRIQSRDVLRFLVIGGREGDASQRSCTANCCVPSCKVTASDYDILRHYVLVYVHLARMHPLV
jgi:hypothetical protein